VRWISLGGEAGLTRALIILAALATGFALALALRLREPHVVYASRVDDVMGAPLDIRIEAASASAARQADAAVRAQIARDTKILSSRDPGSEVSRWLRSSSVATKISPELTDVLASFDEWRARTQGAVDPAVAAVRSVWQRAAEQNRLPTRRELRAALEQVRQRHWVLDRTASIATRTSDVPLILGSLAKGYVFDRAARAAIAVPGVTGIMLSAGGRAVVRGTWTQTVPVSGDRADAGGARAVSDAVVAIRASDRRGFDIAGRHYSPRIDPRSGQPASQVQRVAVISSNPMTADALASAFCVLDPAQSLALAASVPGVEFSITLEGGQRIDSSGWHTFELRPRPAPRAGQTPESTLAAARSMAEGWLLERYL
jgi:thiamine biosynthesis lipoprotein